MRELAHCSENHKETAVLECQLFSVSSLNKAVPDCLTFCDPEDALRLMDERLNEPLVPFLPLLSMLIQFS